MEKSIVSSSQAPAAIGPYSQAVKVGQFVFTSGQIPLTPEGNLEAKDMTSQTEQVLKNLKALLEASGSSLDKVIKCTCFLKDMSQFAAMNEVYGRFFKDNPPARSTVEVARLPRDVLVEIEAIALV
ncbi:MAG: RidA family protein [Deinococcales bacterium]